MARRREAAKREIPEDPVYGSKLVSKFICCLMKDGKKSLAEKIVYNALGVVVQKTSKSAHDSESGDGASGQALRRGYELLKKAIENVSPIVEVRSRRVGGATYQIPVEVSQQRQTALAMRWLILAARKRREKGMTQRLAHEIMDALGRKGGAHEMMERVVKMANANKAFAHYRWN